MTESFSYLIENPWAFVLLAGVLGLLLGSFLNVVIYRLPIMMERTWRMQCQELIGTSAPPAADAVQEEPFNLITPRSRCPHCGHAVSALENIPVVSYLWLRGRCSACGIR